MALHDGDLLCLGVTGAGVESLTQQMIQNPQLMTNIMQAPYMQSMMQSLAGNPEIINQVRVKLSNIGFVNCLGLSSLRTRLFSSSLYLLTSLSIAMDELITVL